MSFLSRKPARPGGRGRDDEYDDFDDYAADSYQSEDDAWSPGEYFSPEGIKGRWAGEHPDGRAGGRGRPDNGRGDTGPGYDSYGDDFNVAEYGGGTPGYGDDEFASGAYDLPDGADEDRPDRSRRRRRDREDRSERTGILRLRRDRGEDIWPDDGISDEDYWASVASDRPLNGTDARPDDLPASSRPGMDASAVSPGQGWAARPPASAASSAAANAGRRDGLDPRRGPPATTSRAARARWEAPGHRAPASRAAAAGRAAVPCPPAPEPAPPPPSGSPPPGRPLGRTACGQAQASRDPEQAGSRSLPRGRHSSRTATSPAQVHPPEGRLAGASRTGATGPSGSSASTPPATPTRGPAAGARAPARPEGPGHPATPRRQDAAAATAASGGQPTGGNRTGETPAGTAAGTAAGRQAAHGPQRRGAVRTPGPAPTTTR